MYEYKAISTETGEIIKGNISEYSIPELKKYLEIEGYYLTKLKKMNYFEKVILSRQRFNAKKLFEISNYFSILLKAGISILEILKLIRNKIKKSSEIEVLNNIINDVKKGELLSNAFNKSGKFPSFYITNIKVGEKTGSLEQVFGDLAEYYFLTYESKNKIKRSLYYPLILFIMTIIIFISFFKYILPSFTSTFDEFGVDLPKITKVLIKLEKTLNLSNTIIIILIVMVLKVFLNKNKTLATKKDEFILKVPGIGSFYRMKLTIEIAKALRIQTNSGLSLKSAIQNIILMHNNFYIREWLIEVLRNLEKGSSLSESLSIKNIMLEESIYIIMIGEKSGQLDESFRQIEKVYTLFLNDNLESIIKLIEPISLIIVSIFIGILLIGVLSPIFKLSNNLYL